MPKARASRKQKPWRMPRRVESRSVLAAPLMRDIERALADAIGRRAGPLWRAMEEAWFSRQAVGGFCGQMSVDFSEPAVLVIPETTAPSSAPVPRPE